MQLLTVDDLQAEVIPVSEPVKVDTFETIAVVNIQSQNNLIFLGY